MAGQDEIPDLVQVTVLPLPGHQHPREHVVDGHPGGSDAGELGVAVGRAERLSRRTLRGGQLASELADVLEVLKALAAAHDMSWEEVVSEAGRKRAERGGFDNRIFLEYVDQAR